MAAFGTLTVTGVTRDDGREPMKLNLTFTSRRVMDDAEHAFRRDPRVARVDSNWGGKLYKTAADALADFSFWNG